MISETKKVRIAIDLMGSDTAPLSLLEGLIAAYQSNLLSLPKQETLEVELYFIIANEFRSEIEASHCYQKKRENPLFFFFCFAESFIAMNEEPLKGLRHKRNSSLQIGIEGLVRGSWGALLSCGNTAALIAAVSLWLPFFSGYKSRPALLVELPALPSPALLLDVGGNADADEQLLLAHAELARAWWLSQKKRERLPRLGLLNMGKEPFKGDKMRRALYDKLSKSKGIEFIGNIEADFLSRQQADIILTDGFSGNIFLKATEGAASCLLRLLQNSNGLPIELTEAESLRQLLYRGAVVAGAKQLVIKCHGRGSSEDLLYAIGQAVELQLSGVLERVEKEL